MASTADLQLYIQHGQEERYLEYKCSMMWTRDVTTKVQIAKAMMAMSNLRNGGVILVGMKETTRGMWEPEGITREQAASFNRDDMAQWVNDRATPAVQFTVKQVEHDGHQFVVVQVREFDLVPTICRKQETVAGIEALKAGAIYYRSNRKNESSPISSDEDMRELVTLAVDKGIANELSRLRKLGLILADAELQRRNKLEYERERSGL